jgi:uncharacterized protein
MNAQERPLWNPYLAGIFLGLVLLASLMLLGFGLGASGAANRLAIGGAALVAPDFMAADPYFARYLTGAKSVLDDWLVFEVLGVFLGGLLGAYSSGRLRRGAIDRGPQVTKVQRLLLALAGGIVMGFAARLARGCTSGQALTGGALLSVGSWAFMLSVFAGGYLMAPLVKRQWLAGRQ